MDSTEGMWDCPICCKTFTKDTIEVHVNQCIFLHTTEETAASTSKDPKRSFTLGNGSPIGASKKKFRLSSNALSSSQRTFSATSGTSMAASPKNSFVLSSDSEEDANTSKSSTNRSINKSLKTTPALLKKQNQTKESPRIEKIDQKPIPLAEQMRPINIKDYIGQSHIVGENAIFGKLINKNEVPSMILWGPPGVGKTTLAHIIANKCKEEGQNYRFVKFSATMTGVDDIKKAITVAKNEQKFKRKTILFMDEIHRFNKLQQDIFLPHVESGVITLIGATTENPSFSLNSALLSRCRVIVLEKLSSENIYEILRRSLPTLKAVVSDHTNENPSFAHLDYVPKVIIEETALKWLADFSDGDARIALNSLNLAMESVVNDSTDTEHELKLVSLDAIRDGIKRSHLLYDRKGDQHYDMISALHKSIRASDDNAALYWCTRMMLGGEDPRYICRRLVRAASEDIGLADPKAVGIALSALDAVQLVGMPESDVIIAQAAIYLARAPKSVEAYRALIHCKRDIKEWKGPLPSVPLHIRNAPTKLMKDLGYGKGYNGLHKDQSGLHYMPEGMESRDYFSDF